MVSLYRRLLPLLTAMMMTLLAAEARAQSAAIARQLPIVMDADHSELDLDSNTTVFFGLRITQGATRIEADRAETSSGTNFADSDWQFQGNVQIDVNNSEIRADRATLKFLNHQLRSARVRGTPARFSGRNPASGELTKGAAERFDYDLESGIVRFENNARLEQGENEVTGKLLLYNVARQQVVFEGDQDTGERVRITVQPPAREDDPASPAADDDSDLP